MQRLAAELNIYIPTSFFERDGQHHYNSLAMIDDAGEIMGVYRKSHIPDGPGYEEKYYFRPGNSGFKVWETRYGTIRSEEHTYELQSLMRISYAVFCLKKKNNTKEYIKSLSN